MAQTTNRGYLKTPDNAPDIHDFECVNAALDAIDADMSNALTGGGGSEVRLDQLFDPTADKTFNMGAHSLTLNAPTATYGLTVNGGSNALILNAISDGTYPAQGLGASAYNTGSVPAGGRAVAVGINAMAEYGGSDEGNSIYGIGIDSGMFDQSPANSFNYGLSIENQNAPGATNWAIKTKIGLVEFGDDTKVHGKLILDSHPPAHNNSPGAAGTIAWDASYLYVCTATDTWKRVALDGTPW